MSVVILGLLVLVAVVSGTVAYFAISTVRATIAEVISILALEGAIGSLLFDVSPHLEQLYIGFGVEIPAVTVWAIRTLRSGHLWGILLMANLIGLGIVGGILFHLQHRQESTRSLARSWSLIATVTVTTLLILWTAAMLLPLPRLLNDLS